MKIITIQMSEEGRDSIITNRVSIADDDYAECYYMSVRDGFIKFPAFTILKLTIDDAPTLDQILIEAEQAIADEMMDKMEEAEQKVLDGEGRFDDFIKDDETGEEVGIVYSENAAPEHDAARSLVQKASSILREPRSGS